MPTYTFKCKKCGLVKEFTCDYAEKQFCASLLYCEECGNTEEFEEKFGFNNHYRLTKKRTWPTR